MIYLLKTFGKDNKEAFKIGYTKDTNYKNRVSAYEAHNPFIEIIHTIPNATEIHEKKLHFKFRKYLLFKNEWFSCEDEIVDYLKSVTLDELDNLPDLDLTDTMVKKYRETIRLSYDIASNRINDFNKYKESKDKLLDRLDRSKKKTNSLSDIYNLFNLLDEDIVLVKKIVNKDYSNLPKELEQIVLMILNEGQFTKKMKLLCDQDFRGEELDYILKQLPPEFSKYYYTLGPERIKAVSCRKCLLEEIYNKLMFNSSNLVNDIYLHFKEGDKLSTLDIINKLIPIYEKHNNPNRPKATDIKEYFEVKAALVTLQDKTRIPGFKLIKRLK